MLLSKTEYLQLQRISGEWTTNKYSSSEFKQRLSLVKTLLNVVLNKITF